MVCLATPLLFCKVMVFWRSLSSNDLGTFHMTCVARLALPPPAIHVQCSIQPLGRPSIISLMALYLCQQRDHMKNWFNQCFSYIPSWHNRRSIFLTMSLRKERSFPSTNFNSTAVALVPSAPGREEHWAHFVNVVAPLHDHVHYITSDEGV